jgi:hypothetical protein
MQKDGEQETLDEQFRFSYPSAEEDFSEIIERRYGRTITRGQTNPAANHEEGSGDQNCQTEEGKTVPVGHTNDRKEAPEGKQTPWTSSLRPLWFDEPTRAIPPNKSWFG